MGAIGLNPIRLDRIGLDPIRIIAIKLGVPGAASDRPYIDPEVLASLKAVCICYGKSNDDPDRAIIKNLVDPDNPFVISNAAFKLNSGFGFYTNFRDAARAEIEVLGEQHWLIKKVTNVIPEPILIGVNKFNRYGYLLRIKCSGIVNTKDVYTNAGGSKTFLQNGINIIDAKNEEVYSSGYIVFGIVNDATNIEIQILPEFEGAFVTDGINDLITSTKTASEMGITNEVTVISMIHQIGGLNSSAVNYGYTNYFRGGDQSTLRNNATGLNKTGIYGYSATNYTPTVINNILGDKNDYTTSSAGFSQSTYGNVFSVVGYKTSDTIAETSSVAWYWTVIANKILTIDQINQVIAYFNLDRTLNPDILCNVKKQGITNENHEQFNNKLIDYSGNGRDIQLNNIAWDGDSGIGKYNYPNWKVNVTQGNKYARIVYYDSINGTYSADLKGVTELYKSYGLSIEIRVNRANTVDFHSIKEDGIYTMTPPDDTTSIDIRFGGENVYNASCDITITQIPSHAGGLCLDGINDFGKVTGMPVYKDYTVVTDREIFTNTGAISSKNNPGAFVETSGNSVYSFGQGTSGLRFISTRSISYLSKYSYCGQSITAGAAEDGTDMWLGTIRDGDSRFFNGAIYSLMSFPYSMSEFLIERQLKKHKLGTLYPDMVEFRPIVKSNNKWDIIEIWQGDKSLYRPAVNDNKTGIYLKKDSTIGIYVKPYVGQKVSEIVYNGVSYTDLKLNSNGFYYKVVPITKSPQKITMTIEQDENYVKFEPVITSNVEYVRLDFYLNNYQKRINIGDYIPKDAYLRANLYLKNNVDELTVFTFNGVNIGYRRSSVDDTAFNIGQIYNYDFPQEVNITIDEYIRYEDIVQPYPSYVILSNQSGNHTYSWGDKLKIGDTIKFVNSINLLKGAYSLNGRLNCNGVYVYNNDKNIVVSKEMIFAYSQKAIWTFDDNEPKCILSPRLLRIPNSSYKILGYIPDISGHGNHGKINNSAYAEGSGVNEDGSYQFDGVDDFVTIPTLSSGGKQMLMKVNWNSLNHVLYDQRNNAEAPFCIVTASGTIAYNQRNVGGNTYIDGILNNHILVDDLQAITHNIVLNNDYNVANSNSFIGTNYTKSIYAKMSLYDFMLFDEISTDDKIKELNEYVGMEGNTDDLFNETN